MERKNAVDKELVTHHMWKKMEDLPEIKERKKISETVLPRRYINTSKGENLKKNLRSTNFLY